MAARGDGAQGRLDAGEVQAMFDRIAGVYDAMNTAMTAGLHHRWRARAADLACVGLGDRVLDVATGTGDLAIELARRVGPSGEVVACDFARSMLARAQAKADAVAPQMRVEWADALSLPYEDASFRAATVGFGARNFDDLQLGLREMSRVVAPGGRVVVLEITTPTRPLMSRMLSLWFDHAVPMLGRLTADGAAYRYLPRSVRRFPGPEQLAALLTAAGLQDVRYILTAGGIIAIHAGTVPAAAPVPPT